MIYQLNNFILYKNEIVERVENNFINIYKKFDIINEKLNNYHIKFDKINKVIDLIISNERTKIYKTYYPMKNYDLSQDQFFPGPPAFCKKAVERVRSEKNILNSSVEWSGVGGTVFFRKSPMYVHHQIGLNELINMMYFI